MSLYASILINGRLVCQSRQVLVWTTFYLPATMIKNYLKVLCILVLTMIPGLSHAIELKVIRKDHPMDMYTLEALKLVLSKLGGKYTIHETPDNLTQDRTVEMVKEGKVDVYWMASSAEFEKLLKPIRIPLMKGLLGHRISIINPEAQSKFNQVNSLADVQKLRFGQGRSWPDTVILRDSGFEVVTCNKYLGLFNMVEGGRFDAFPRGVLEAWSETAARPELGLTVEQNLLMIYRLPVYFFVANGRNELAADIQRGLEISMADGSFDEFFFSNKSIVDALEKSNLKNRKAFYLDNPFLSPETPLDNKEYWLNIADL